MIIKYKASQVLHIKYLLATCEKIFSILLEHFWSWRAADLCESPLKFFVFCIRTKKSLN